MNEDKMIKLLKSAIKAGYVQALNRVYTTINTWEYSDDDDSSFVEKIADLRKEEPDYDEILGKQEQI